MVAPRMDETLRGQRQSAAPLRTEGTAWDIAYAALYLCSDEARWVNGVTLLSPAQTDTLLDRLWHLEDVEDIGEIIRLTRI